MSTVYANAEDFEVRVVERAGHLSGGVAVLCCPTRDWTFPFGHPADLGTLLDKARGHLNEVHHG